MSVNLAEFKSFRAENPGNSTDKKYFLKKESHDFSRQSS
ncbi:hypothetical protein LZ3411_2013 [Levilactobacillus zymae]|uniref:Uncharacterized protein n=1 Tax=Levilactobacillus zymae TaxID=267363 RepID=A0A1Y6K1U2_9LACO|nr:hypothetical protein LZ3411_2013 [Levilactobacillus zymae]